MKLRFTRTAARQLDRVLAEIAAQSSRGADRVQTRIAAAINVLLRYPYSGQATSRSGVRRIVVVPHPYVVTYRVGNDEIVVRTVRHAARKPIR